MEHSSLGQRTFASKSDNWDTFFSFQIFIQIIFNFIVSFVYLKMVYLFWRFQFFFSLEV